MKFETSAAGADSTHCKLSSMGKPIWLDCHMREQEADDTAGWPLMASYASRSIHASAFNQQCIITVVHALSGHWRKSGVVW